MTQQMDINREKINATEVKQSKVTEVWLET